VTIGRGRRRTKELRSFINEKGRLAAYTHDGPDTRPKHSLLEGSVVLSSGREVSVLIVLYPLSDLTKQDKKELRGARIALHDLTPYP
jgi:hypothetical protein